MTHLVYVARGTYVRFCSYDSTIKLTHTAGICNLHPFNGIDIYSKYQASISSGLTPAKSAKFPVIINLVYDVYHNLSSD
jgi:hypothetical protein